MTGDLETRLRRYGETFERYVDADSDAVVVSRVPAFSMVTADEFERRRVTRRAPVVGAIAACLAVALVVGWLVFSGSNDPSAVQAPAGLPAAGADWGCAGKAYVTIGSDDTVSVITMATGKVSATMIVGGTPTGVAVTPDGTHAYVPVAVVKPDGDAGGAVSVITTATGAVSAPIPVGGAPTGVAITPDGTHVYVTTVNGDGGGEVSVITTATGAVSATIPIGGVGGYPYAPRGPRGVAITPDGAHAYVINNDGTVSVIMTATGAVSATIPVGGAPAGVAITPDGTHAYVTTRSPDVVKVITTATGAVSATIPVGAAPGGVAITPDGTRAYVTNAGDGTVSVITTATGAVSVITTATGAVSAPVPAWRGPAAVAITADGKRAYVTNSTPVPPDGGFTPTLNRVSVITTATGAVSPITVGGPGGAPTGVAICPVMRNSHRR